METFPGGVLSADGRIGVVHLAAAEIVAVELASGRELWRRNSTDRPVAASRRHLVSLGAGGRLSVRDLSSGEPSGSRGAAAVPGWVADLRERPDALQFTAREAPGGLSVTWSAERRQTGGIVKSPELEAASGRDTGELTIALTSPDELVEEGTPPPEELSKLPSGYAPIAGEIARRQVGDTHFVLTLDVGEGGKPAAKLRALAADDSEQLWETKLGDIEVRSRPTPLRK